MNPQKPEQLCPKCQELYKYKLLTTLRSFKQFCSTYELKYIAAYGTVLGAVRHKGLIPWDDDIDVYMPRNDYERFLRLKEQAYSIGYEILDPSMDGYYLSFAKFCDRNTTIWELERFPFIIGIFIDVFPIDYTADTIEETFRIKREADRKLGKYQVLLVDFSIHELVNSLIRCKGRTFICELKRLFLKNTIGKKKADYFSYLQKISSLNGNDYIYYHTSLIESGILKKEWLDEVIEVSFEDDIIFIPKDFDGYLKYFYGDYLTPPPLDKRVSQHFHYFVDLERRLTIDEIKEIKKNEC